MDRSRGQGQGTRVCQSTKTESRTRRFVGSEWRIVGRFAMWISAVLRERGPTLSATCHSDEVATGQGCAGSASYGAERERAAAAHLGRPAGCVHVVFRIAVWVDESVLASTGSRPRRRAGSATGPGRTREAHDLEDREKGATGDAGGV